MKQKLALLLAVVMLFSVFAACGKKESAGSENNGETSAKPGGLTDASQVSKDSSGTISVTELAEMKVYPSDTAQLDVAFNMDFTYLCQPGNPPGGAYVAQWIFFDTLIGWDAANNCFAPKLATSWEWVNDTTLRMKLREDVTSHAGDPFTANDVLYTFKWGCETSTQASYYSMFDIDNFKVIDDYTIDIALFKPYPFLILDLTTANYEMVVEKTVNDLGGREATQYNPACGTGPYKLISYQNGEYIKCERREDYWGTKCYWKYVTIWVVTDGTVRAMGVEAGDYDVALQPSRSQTLEAMSNPNLAGWAMVSVGYMNLVLNSENEYLKVKEARQAIALAIDYENVVKVAISGLGAVCDSTICIPTNEYYRKPGESAKNYENYIYYDLSKAKEKLIEAGFPNGFPLELTYTSSDPMQIAAGEAVSSMLGAAGIQCTCGPREAATFSTERREGKFDAYIAVGANPNPKNQLIKIDPRSSHSAASGWAGSAWCGDVDYVGELMDKCLTTVDDTQRYAYWAELQDYCREWVPSIIVGAPHSVCITNPSFVNVGRNSTGAVVAWECYPEEYLTGPKV